MILDLRKESVLDSAVYDSLKRISLNLKDRFNSLIGIVSEDLSENLDWLVGIPASRNTLQSPLFYRFCCIHLVIELVQRGIIIEKVIVDSTALFRAINELKAKRDFDFEIEGPNNELPNFHCYIWGSLKPFFIAWKRKKIQFRAARKTRDLSSTLPKLDLTLIDQFVFP